MSHPQPYDMDAERALIGGLLLDPPAIAQVIERVDATDFYSQACGAVYGAMVTLEGRGQPVDYVSVAAELDHMDALERVGGRAALIDWANSTPTAAHTVYYAVLVADLAERRRLIEATGRMAGAACDRANDALAFAEQQVAALAMARRTTEHQTTIAAALIAELDRIDRVLEGGMMAGLATGFYDLDRITGGLQRGDLAVLAARPGVGKSAFALCIAHRVAVRDGKRVVICSMEMGREQLVQRLLSIEGAIDASMVRSGRLSDDEYQRLIRAAAAVNDADMAINDAGRHTTASLSAYARQAQRERPIDLVIVDYIQLLDPGTTKRGESRAGEVDRMARDLKAMARDLGVPVLALAQLNREVDHRTDHRPVLADLRDSSGVEANADLVLFLHRDAVYDQDADPHVAELIVAKHRSGPVGSVPLFWDATYTRYSNLMRQQAGSVRGAAR